MLPALLKEKRQASEGEIPLIFYFGLSTNSEGKAAPHWYDKPRSKGQ